MFYDPSISPQIGDVLEFLYPIDNRFEVDPPELEWRQVRINHVQDLTTTPIDAAAVASDSTLRRGRWLVTGLDLERQVIRSFYLDWQHAKSLALALFVDGESVIIGEPSKPTAASRRVLGEACRKYLSSSNQAGEEDRFRLAVLLAS